MPVGVSVGVAVGGWVASTGGSSAGGADGVSVPNCKVITADLRDMPFEQEFQTVFVIGRVFTHMTTNDDLFTALRSCRRALTHSGRLLADNYEDTRIEVTDYFNGTTTVCDRHTTISRVSTTSRVSDSPFIVRWKAEYFGTFDGSPFRFTDSIDHRAFSRAEFSRHLGEAGFQVVRRGDNFDETIFFTLGEKVG